MDARVIESERMLLAAACHMRSVGLVETADMLESLGRNSLPEYIDKICELTLSIERKKFQEELALKYMAARMQLQIDYEIFRELENHP